MWFHQNPPPPSVTPENHMIPPKSLSSPIRYPWKPCDPLKSSAPLSITPENHMTPTKSSASTLRCRWKPCDSSKSSAPLSVTPENNAIPQNPPPPFITPKNHMTPTKSSASILRCRWKPCDPLKSSVPPLPLEISPKAVGRTIFPLSNLTEEWGGVYVLFTLEHMLEFWVNHTRISTHTLWPCLQASIIPVTDGKTLLKRHSSSTQLQSAVAISQLKGKAYWLFPEPITPDFLFSFRSTKIF